MKMICKKCGQYSDTINGICGNCIGKQTVRNRHKQKIRKSTIPIIVCIVIAIGTISFITSGLLEETTQKVSETTKKIQDSASDFSEKIEQERIQQKIEREIREEQQLLDTTKRIHELVNEERVSRGLSSLSWNPTISKAALSHSNDMLSRGYFEHDSPEGHDFTWRYAQVGFTCEINRGNWIYGGGENIMHLQGYVGTETISKKTVEGWMNSPGHRENILTPYFKTEGIGIAKYGNEVYVTQNFC